MAAALFALVIGGPVLAGLAGVLALAPAHMAQALALPGLGTALALSLGPGLAAALIATGLTGLILAFRPFAGLIRLIPALLALPHAALSLGLILLFAPSGLVMRALAPFAGWTAPPGVHLVQDGWGLGLTLGLVLKETPFLLALALAAHGPEVARMNAVAAPYGHGRALRLALIDWPLIYPALRLPILAVLAYGMTTVDMGSLLGPGLPAPLSVRITEAAARPDAASAGLAAALALIQLALVALALGLWRGVEALGARTRAALISRGTRAPGLDPPLRALARGAALLLVALPLAATAMLVLWAFIGRWPFPGLVPPLSWQPLGRLADLGPLAATTLGLAVVSTGLALALTLWRLQGSPSRAEALVWLPLILPQVAFLPGLAQLALRLDAEVWPGPWGPTLLGHLTFVLPYLWLSLAGPWRAWNPRLGQVAATLGAGPGRILWHLRLPMIAPSLAWGLAIGLAVSVGQYLPTLLLSGGRLPTLTTEAVALASGTDRARIAALALAQAALPLLAFLLAARVKAFPSPKGAAKQAP